jgi:AcrR family transcriptional regulator
MARRKGSTNLDYAERRAELLNALRKAWMALPPPASLRALSEAVGVTLPTLRHYFGGREQLVAAILQDIHQGSAPHLAIAARPTGPLEPSVADLVGHVWSGLSSFGLDRLHALCIAEGLAVPKLGRAYLDELLEPSLRAVTDRLAEHQARGELIEGDPRTAALALLGSLIVLALHQGPMGGRSSHPADLQRMLNDLARAFVRAWGAAGTSQTGRTGPYRGS